VIRIVRGDLARSSADAVLRPVTAEWAAVTQATRRLEIAAGPSVEAQCRAQGELPVGSAIITPAGDIAAQFMIHVVIRSADERVTEAGVRRGLQNGLRRLVEWGIQRVALPPLGTGAGNLDAEESAAIMIPVLREHMAAAGIPAEVDVLVDSDYEQEVFERRLHRSDAPSDSPAASGI
jgi:O-acetyl-ADP-ribose deacetylase